MEMLAPKCTMFPFLVKPFVNRDRCEFVPESQLLLVRHLLSCVPPWRLLEAAKSASYLDSSGRLTQLYLALCVSMGREFDEITGVISWRRLYQRHGIDWHEDVLEKGFDQVLYFYLRVLICLYL